MTKRYASTIIEVFEPLSQDGFLDQGSTLPYAQARQSLPTCHTNYPSRSNLLSCTPQQCNFLWVYIHNGIQQCNFFWVYIHNGMQFVCLLILHLCCLLYGVTPWNSPCRWSSSMPFLFSFLIGFCFCRQAHDQLLLALLSWLSTPCGEGSCCQIHWQWLKWQFLSYSALSGSKTKANRIPYR